MRLRNCGHFDALITALFGGVSESPPWTTFLDRLRKATGADHALLLLSPLGRRWEDAVSVVSGSVPDGAMQQASQSMPPLAESTLMRTPREGWPYSLVELIQLNEDAFVKDRVMSS